MTIAEIKAIERLAMIAGNITDRPRENANKDEMETVAKAERIFRRHRYNRAARACKLWGDVWRAYHKDRDECWDVRWTIKQLTKAREEAADLLTRARARKPIYQARIDRLTARIEKLQARLPKLADYVSL